MKQEQIDRYVDNLGVNEQVHLLKRVLWLLNTAHKDYDQYNGGDERGSDRDDFEFIKHDIPFPD